MRSGKRCAVRRRSYSTTSKPTAVRKSFGQSRRTTDFRRGRRRRGRLPARKKQVDGATSRRSEQKETIDALCLPAALVVGGHSRDLHQRVPPMSRIDARCLPLTPAQLALLVGLRVLSLAALRPVSVPPDRHPPAGRFARRYRAGPRRRCRAACGLRMRMARRAWRAREQPAEERARPPR